MECASAIRGFAMLVRLPLALFGCWIGCSTITAAPPIHDTKALAETVRILLLANLPDPLVESNMGWDTQREVAIGVKWEKKGLIRYQPSVMRDVKNDGHWQKLHFHAKEPEKSLTVTVANVRVPEVGKTLFDARIGLDTKLVYEQQMWTAGKRLYAGETHARCRAELLCVVELTDKIETRPGSVLPVITIRARVAEANLSYKDLVCESTFGLHGEPAKVVGKALLEVIKKLQPNAEKDLLAKANAAIVKAADTKEVRVELDKLLQPKAGAGKILNE